MNLNEALKKLNAAGYKVLKESRYNEYSDIGMNPGWDDDCSGRYVAQVEWLNNDNLKNASQKIFGNEDFLYDVMCNFDVPDKVTFYYNERNDDTDDFEWYDEGTESWFEDQELELIEQINDMAETDKINYNKEYVKEHINDICELLQQSVNASIENYLYKTREPI